MYLFGDYCLDFNQSRYRKVNRDVAIMTLPC